jgi:hypothetical protein
MPSDGRRISEKCFGLAAGFREREGLQEFQMKGREIQLAIDLFTVDARRHCQINRAQWDRE